jgi:hypothetical protein
MAREQFVRKQVLGRVLHSLVHHHLLLQQCACLTCRGDDQQVSTMNGKPDSRPKPRIRALRDRIKTPNRDSYLLIL